MAKPSECAGPESTIRQQPDEYVPDEDSNTVISCFMGALLLSSR